MRILVLGAHGFLGSRLVQKLLLDGSLNGQQIREIVLFDQRRVEHSHHKNLKQSHVTANLTDVSALKQIFSQPVDVVFHMAATLTLDAENNFRRGLENNVLALIELLELCRTSPQRTKFVFASSISTFGGQLPDVVTDEVFQAPTTSYGTQKVIAEQLIADYSRHGYVDGRVLRLPIVVTHPGPSSGSISDQVSALVREPIKGNTVVCRMRPDRCMAVVSVETVVSNFIKLASMEAHQLGQGRVMNQPGLSVTPEQLIAAVARHMHKEHSQFVRWELDETMDQIIQGWPQKFISERAKTIGLRTDSAVEQLVQAFVQTESRRNLEQK